MAQRILGIDLGTHTLKAVVLQSALRGVTPLKFLHRPTPLNDDGTVASPELLAASILEMLKAHKLNAEFVVVGLPGDRVSSRIIKMPFKELRKIQQTIGFQIEGVLPFKLNQVSYDYQIITNTDEGSSLLVSSIRREILQSYLRAFKAVGLDPRIMTLSTLTYANLMGQVLSGASGSYAVADLGHSCTDVAVFNGGRLQFVRTISRGGRALTSALAAESGLSFAESELLKHQQGAIGAREGVGTGTQAKIAEIFHREVSPLVRELRRTLVTAGSGLDRPQKLYLCGGTSKLKGLRGYLQKALDIKTERLPLESGPFAALSADKGELPLSAKPLATALRGAQNRSGQINLRKGDYAFAGDFQFMKSRVISVAVGLFLILAAAIVLAVVKYNGLKSYETKQKSYLRFVTKRILGKEESEFVVALNKLTAAKKVNKNPIIPTHTAFDYFVAISKNIGKERVDVKKLVIGLKRINMAGEVDAEGALDKIVGALNDFECFKKRVRVIESRANQLNKRFTFRILISPSC